MATSLVGGNLEQLDQLQRSFRSESEAVSQLAGRINGVISGTTWLGPAAEAFRGQFSSQFLPALRGLQVGLDEQATIVAGRREAIAAATG